MKPMTLITWLTAMAVVLLVAPTNSSWGAKSSAGEPRSRTFQFDYGATLERLPAGATLRVWLPVPPTNGHQKIKTLPSLLPANAITTVEPIYGNKILYVEANVPTSGKLTFKTSYEVRRNEVLGLSESDGKNQLSDRQRTKFLSANKQVPLKGKQLSLLKGVSLSRDSLTMARTLYDRVDDHVRYDKSRPGYGNGDVV